MAAQFPPTSLSLLSKLKQPGETDHWQFSWKRFLELYHEPIEVIARSCYRHHTSGHEPSSGFIEDAVANTVADFFARSQYRYDKEKAGCAPTFASSSTPGSWTCSARNARSNSAH